MLTEKERRGPRGRTKTLQMEDRFEQEKKEKTKKNLLRRLVCYLLVYIKSRKVIFFKKPNQWKI